MVVGGSNMNDKTTWVSGSATVTGGGLDGLMILAALERIEERLKAIQEKLKSKKRRRHGTSDPCGSSGGAL